MKNILVVLPAAVAILGCGGKQAFTRGSYEDPTKIQMLSDKFNENDLQLIANKMIESMLGHASISGATEKPKVIVEAVRNKTSEHIDTESLTDKIRVQLINSGKVRFIDNAGRENVAKELEYQSSGYVDPNQAKQKGQQIAADMMLAGVVSQIVQEVGDDKLVYYKVTMTLTSINTGEIVWTEEKEIRKKFQKQAV